MEESKKNVFPDALYDYHDRRYALFNRTANVIQY